jgi:putative sugar O-methyltransferase
MRYDFNSRAQAMVQEIASAPEFLPSKFWEDLNQKNMRMLSIDGLKLFKRTVSLNYFNWLISSRNHPFHGYLDSKIGKPNLLWRSLILSERKTEVRLTTTDQLVSLTNEQIRDYAYYVTMTWEIMRQHDKLGVSRIVREPLVGDPIRVRRGLRLISQDLANSIIEYNTIAPYLPIAASKRPAVGEIGAGYGRLAYVAAVVGAVRYAIFDIPPALAVTEFYLNKTLPHKRIFKFRPFRSFGEVEQELEEADIVLCTANQIQMFPDKWFSLMLSISTLPEMNPQQVAIYLDQMRRLASKGIFLKQWSNWRNEADGTQLHPDDYSPREGWTLALDRQDPIIPDFFNQIWLRSRTSDMKAFHSA